MYRGARGRDGVFLRTSKTGSDQHRLRKALRLTRVELLLAAALYAAAGYFASVPHPPWILVFIIAVQGSVYMCSPIASLWNVRAERVSTLDYRHRFEQRRLRQASRRRPSVRVVGPAIAAVLALGVGGLTGAFVAPATLMSASATVPRPVSAQSVLHLSQAMVAYVGLRQPSSKQQGPYYPVSSLELSKAAPSSTRSDGGFVMSFDTSSTALLAAVSRDYSPASGMAALTVVVRKPASGTRPATTEMADTFDRPVVTSFSEVLSGSPAGAVTFLLPSTGQVLTSGRQVRTMGPFAKASVRSGLAATHDYVKMSSAPSKRAGYYSVTGVSLSQAAPATPRSPARLTLSFHTSSLALLDEVIRYSGGLGRGIAAAAAADEDPAVGALEAHAVGEVVVNDHGRAVGVFRLDVVGAVDVPQALLGELGLAFDLDRPGHFGAHAPVGDIHVVRAPAGDHAQAVGVNAQPAGPVRDAVLRMHAVLGVGRLRRAAQPHLVVQVGRDGHLLLGRRRRGPPAGRS